MGRNLIKEAKKQIKKRQKKIEKQQRKWKKQRVFFTNQLKLRVKKSIRRIIIEDYIRGDLWMKDDFSFLYSQSYTYKRLSSFDQEEFLKELVSELEKEILVPKLIYYIKGNKLWIDGTLEE